MSFTLLNYRISQDTVRIVCDLSELIKKSPLPRKKTYKLIWADDAELNSLDRAQWACAVAGGRSVHPVYSKRRVLPRHAAL